MVYSAGFALQPSMHRTGSAARYTGCKVSAASTGICLCIKNPMCKRQEHLSALWSAQALFVTSITLPTEPCNNQVVLFEAVSLASLCCKSCQLTAGNRAKVLPDCGDCNNLFCLFWPDPSPGASRALCFCCFRLISALASIILTLSML